MWYIIITWPQVCISSSGSKGQAQRPLIKTQLSYISYSSSRHGYKVILQEFLVPSSLVWLEVRNLATELVGH